MVSAIANRATVVAVAAAGVVALLAFPLPYELGLPLAVLAALASGSVADFAMERAAARRARAEPRGRDLTGLGEEDL